MESIQIAWSGLHFGEEPVISGTKGSGTIFFSQCNLKCVFCQNWQISNGIVKCKNYSVEEVVEIMLSLQGKGAHNINLVSPTVWVYFLKKIIPLAKKRGLTIPMVWNSNGYEEVRVLRDLKGLIDIYLPDYKYSFNNLGEKYSGVKNYPQKAQKAILEMQRQVGDLKIERKEGVAERGLVVRHLVLPGLLKNTQKCLEFIRSISDNICLSLMSQYNPTYKASKFQEINRCLTQDEYGQVMQMMKDLDFKFGWIQEFEGAVKCLNPDFNKEYPFSL